jgi:hypothetical protein
MRGRSARPIKGAVGREAATGYGTRVRRSVVPDRCETFRRLMTKRDLSFGIYSASIYHPRDLWIDVDVGSSPKYCSSSSEAFLAAT